MQFIELSHIPHADIRFVHHDNFPALNFTPFAMEMHHDFHPDFPWRASMRRNRVATSNRLSRTFGAERLESRDLMAGDVSVVKSGRTLIITGTNAANDVVVVGDAVPGTFHVFGIDADASGDNTSLNGGLHDFALGSLDFTGIRYLSVNMKGGNDFFMLTGVPVSAAANRLRDVTVDLGAGDDVAEFGFFQELPGVVDAGVQADIEAVAGNVASYGGVTVLGGSGTDSVYVAGSFVAKNFTAVMGSGDDAVAIAESVFGSINVNLEAGNAAFAAASVRVTGNVKVHAGTSASTAAVVSVSDFDIGGCLSISAGAGTAVITVAGGDVGRSLCISTCNTAANPAIILVDVIDIELATTITTCAGNDTVDFYNSSTDTLVITTGAGNDTVDIAIGAVAVTTNIARCAVISTCSGEDDVHISGDFVDNTFFGQAAFDKLTVATGTQNDCVAIGATLVRVCAVFDGGLGWDNYDDNGGNTFQGKYTRVLFETYVDCEEEEEGDD